MSKSPFARQANGLMTFSVAVSGYTEDPATGNPIERRTDRLIWAMVNRPSTRNAVSEMPGPDQEIVRLTGRSVEPSLFPNWVRAGAIATLAITDLATGMVEFGRFTFTSVQQSQFKEVTRALGSYFEGTFQLDRRGEMTYEN
jgi:hypothetical protein